MIQQVLNDRQKWSKSLKIHKDSLSLIDLDAINEVYDLDLDQNE